MLSTQIPGFGTLTLDHLVLDYNGTLAVDGLLLPGVKSALNALAAELVIHVVTADTFGKAADGLDGVNCRLTVLEAGRQDQAKANFVNRLGGDRTASIGNGRNDALMLAASALGIAVILGEGASMASLNAADIVCADIVSALELLMHPLRLTATLRS
ncbi:ATPase P [uncultured Desulfosarcina sp.]|uniref:HAD family hydrolase n=1 Tax=uncultured Desulfosarcina sp. TaxID=218289 RepID=UPI0029C6634B|nr:ATPase P [uncultured Desulfosarcina sp.]